MSEGKLCKGVLSIVLLAIILSLSILLPTFEIRPVSAQAVEVGVPKLIGFEDLQNGAITGIEYKAQGLEFVNEAASPGVMPLHIASSKADTASPRQILLSNGTEANFSRNCEFGSCRLIQDMIFAVPQYRISFSTGLAGDILPSHIGGYLVVLSGYTGPVGAPGSEQVVSATTKCLGGIATPVLTPLQIRDSQARIKVARISIAECDNISNSPLSGSIVIDNLLYDRPLNPPPQEQNPPEISGIYPANGATVMGSAPGVTSMILFTNVTEDYVYTMTATVNGRDSMPMSFFRLNEHEFTAWINLDTSTGLKNGSNTVSLNVTDFDPPNRHDQTRSISFTYLTAPIPPPSSVDIYPGAFEVTQVIDTGPQSLTLNDYSQSDQIFRVAVPNSPPLVQEKMTLLRIYGLASGSDSDIANVPATISVYRDNCQTNCLLASLQAPVTGPSNPGGPPTPNPSGINVQHIVSSREHSFLEDTPNLGDTWNFLLYPGWTGGDLRVVVTVNDGKYAGLSPVPEATECVSSAVETPPRCQNNNVVELHIHFNQRPKLYINPVYIHVTGAGVISGKVYNDVVTSPAQVSSAFDDLNELYPIELIPGVKYHMTASPDKDEGDILDILEDTVGIGGIWARGFNSQVDFLGFFPALQANPFGDFKVNLIAGGTGNVEAQGAWADDVKFNKNGPTYTTTEALAHELGHNIGFDHWTCLHQESDDCEVFPIDHGRIGGIGTDIRGWQVIMPEDPACKWGHAHDFMTYGDCRWISTISYGILFSHSTIASYDVEDPPAMLVSGHIDAKELATFQPMYQINASRQIADHIFEDDLEEIYTITGYDEAGNILLVHNFEPSKRDTTPEKTHSFHEAIPIIPKLFRIEVSKGSQVLGEMKNPSPATVPTVQVTSPAAGDSWQKGTVQNITWTGTSPSAAPLSALVEYSPDGGNTILPLARNVNGSSIQVKTDDLAGGSNAVVYVQVSDGFNTAQAQSSQFTIEQKSPEVHIVNPSGKFSLYENMPTSFEGLAYDAQNIPAEDKFKWTSNRDGPLGTGREITVNNLSPGQHSVTLTVTDAVGLVGKDTISLQVVPFAQNKTLPVAQAGPQQTASENSTVILDGSGSHSTMANRTLTYFWKQIGAGPKVNLQEANTATPKFIAPQINGNTTLTFQLIVNDGTADSKPSFAEVLVVHRIPEFSISLIIMTLGLAGLLVMMRVLSVFDGNRMESRIK